MSEVTVIINYILIIILENHTYYLVILLTWRGMIGGAYHTLATISYHGMTTVILWSCHGLTMVWPWYPWWQVFYGKSVARVSCHYHTLAIPLTLFNCTTCYGKGLLPYFCHTLAIGKLCLPYSCHWMILTMLSPWQKYGKCMVSWDYHTLAMAR